MANTTRANFRTYSHNKGDKWWQMDIATWSAVQMLFIVEFANLNSQSALSYGCTSQTKAAGYTDSAVYHTIKAGSSSKSNQYRWIENPWGQVYDWVDGFVAYNRQCYLSLDNASFGDTTAGMTDSGITLPSSNYITGFGQSEQFPWAFLPDAASGGSASTFVPDYVYSSTGTCVLCVGGNYSGDVYCGLFCFIANSSATYAYSNIGSRLLYIP